MKKSRQTQSVQLSSPTVDSQTVGWCEEGSIRGKSMEVENAIGKWPQVVANIAGVHVVCLIDLQVGVGKVNSDRGFLPPPPRGEGQPTDGWVVMISTQGWQYCMSNSSRLTS